MALDVNLQSLRDNATATGFSPFTDDGSVVQFYVNENETGICKFNFSGTSINMDFNASSSCDCVVTLDGEEVFNGTLPDTLSFDGLDDLLDHYIEISLTYTSGGLTAFVLNSIDVLCKTYEVVVFEMKELLRELKSVNAELELVKSEIQNQSVSVDTASLDAKVDSTNTKLDALLLHFG